MKKVTQQKHEPRLHYLVRVAIEMLRDNQYSIGTIHYDEAECDAACLAEDLQIELNQIEP